MIYRDNQVYDYNTSDNFGYPDTPSKPQYPYPPQQPYPQPQRYPQTPPYQHPYYGPPPKKDNKLIIAVIVIVIILAVILPLTSMVLYVWTSGIRGTSGLDGPIGTPSVGFGMESSAAWGWSIPIVTVSGSTFKLKDAKFQMLDENGIRVWTRDITEVNPQVFTRGKAEVYAIPTDETLANDVDYDGSAVDSTVDLTNYENCSVAYLDNDADEEVSAGDTIFIYKDNDNDGVPDILSGYTFELLYKDDIVEKASL